MALTAEQKQAALREELRADRTRNYRIKAAHGFKCDECGAHDGIAVVRLKQGGDDECFGTRCGLHVRNLEVLPGQFTEAEKA